MHLQGPIGRGERRGFENLGSNQMNLEMKKGGASRSKMEGYDGERFLRFAGGFICGRFSEEREWIRMRIYAKYVLITDV